MFRTQPDPLPRSTGPAAWIPYTAERKFTHRYFPKPSSRVSSTLEERGRPGVVDQDVKRAERLDGAINGGSDRVPIPDVGLDGDRPPDPAARSRHDGDATFEREPFHRGLPAIAARLPQMVTAPLHAKRPSVLEGRFGRLA
jgi:hypothetical protein